MKRIGLLYQITCNTNMFLADFHNMRTIPVFKDDILVSVDVLPGGTQTILLHPNGLVRCGHTTHELIEKSTWNRFLKRIE